MLSAASLGSQINFIMSLLLFGIMSGASVLIAQYWGRKNMEAIEKVFGMAMKVSACVGVFFMVVTMAVPGYLMQIFTNDAKVISYGAEYLRIVCLSYLIIPLTMAYLNTMRSMESVVIASVVYLSSMMVNIVVNALLIFGLFGFPVLGIKGAAIGTVLARMAEVLIIVVYDRKFNHILRFQWSYLLKKDAGLWKDFVKYSLPVMANELFWGAGVSSISAVPGHMGSAVVLIARPIAISALALMPGAQKYFSFMMYIMSYFVIGQSVNSTVVVGICRSGGDTKFGLFLDLIFMWCVAIAGGILAAFVLNLGVYVTYIVLLSDEVMKLPITLWRYRTKKWLCDVTRM